MTAKVVNIRPADDRILKALHRYHYLTAHQLCRLLAYKPGSLTYLQTMLKRLSDASYCQRLFLPRPSQHGSAPTVYTLGRRGVEWLEKNGIERERRLRPKEQKESSYLFLEHTLCANDFLIAAELLCRKTPQVVLHAMKHELALKHNPAKVQDREGKEVAVIPDGWLDLRINNSAQYCLSLELDRGTEKQWKWQRKVETLLLWNDGPYQERFETTSLTVAVVATPGNRRMKQLQHWTETKLQESGRVSADIFRFTDLEPGTANPSHLFFGNCWYRPFDEIPVPLLEGGVQ